MTTATKPGASALWIFLLTAASTAATFVLACATPFSALAALAAVHMRRNDAVKLMALVWLASQVVGFGFLDYPHRFSTFAWAAALCMAAVGALLGADHALSRRMPKSAAGQLALAYVAAFVAFKAVIFVWALGLGGLSTSFDPAIVTRQFLRDGAILIGLYAFYRLLRAAGVPAPRPRLAAA